MSYKIFCKDLPHTTNPKLEIIDEDNYKDIKYPNESNDINIIINNYNNFKVEYLTGSFFSSELLNTENKIYNYLMNSVDFLSSIGKMIKQKGLYEIKIEDINIIKNYIKMSYMIKEIIKNFETIKEIKNYNDIESNIKVLLIYVSLFNSLNILINGKISSIFIFYFIKYGGFKYILLISKKFLNFCKNELEKNKKEIPIVELLIIKNLWSLLAGLMLFLLKYSFSSNSGFYILLIRENNISKNFDNVIELDAYIKYLMLNDFIDVFFDKNNLEYNINIIKDIEIFSTDLMRTIFILFDNCCRIYSNINDIKKNEMNIKKYIIKDIKFMKLYK